MRGCAASLERRAARLLDLALTRQGVAPGANPPAQLCWKAPGVHILPGVFSLIYLKIITKCIADKPSATETRLPHYRV